MKESLAIDAVIDKDELDERALQILKTKSSISLHLIREA